MPKKTLSALFVEYAKPDPSRVIDYSDQEIDSYGAMRRGLAVSRGGDGLVFTSHRGLVNESTHDATTGL